MERYSAALRDACLADDIDSFAKRDHTEIGEHGVTLSGGQKARVALARALYSDADVYLLDDPLAAVDAKVSRRLFERSILGLRARGKAVVLVTHQTQYANEADAVFAMDGGELKPVRDSDALREVERRMMATSSNGLATSSSGGVTASAQYDAPVVRSRSSPAADDKTTAVSAATLWFYLAQWGMTLTLAALVPLSFAVSCTTAASTVWITLWSKDALHLTTTRYITGMRAYCVACWDSRVGRCSVLLAGGGDGRHRLCAPDCDCVACHACQHAAARGVAAYHVARPHELLSLDAVGQHRCAFQQGHERR